MCYPVHWILLYNLLVSTLSYCHRYLRTENARWVLKRSVGPSPQPTNIRDAARVVIHFQLFDWYYRPQAEAEPANNTVLNVLIPS